MSKKQANKLAELKHQDSTKQLASQLTSKGGNKKAWTKAFAASGAKPGGKGNAGA